MKLLLLLFTAGLISCNKNNETVPAGNPNNIVNAVIDTSGSPFTLHAAGNATIFDRSIYSNGDTVIGVLGSNNGGSVHIRMINITHAGSYQFGDSGGNKYILLSYEVGNALTNNPPFYMYLNDNSRLTGSIIVDSLTNSYIKGTFMDTCRNGTDTAIITGGTFTGYF